MALEIDYRDLTNRVGLGHVCTEDIDLSTRLQTEETTPLGASWRFHRENAVRAARHTARPLVTPKLSAVSRP
jgi:hypothetical protein